MSLDGRHRRAALALILLLLMQPMAAAHPHNYIQVDAVIMIENGMAKALRYVWRFDAKYLDGLKEEYDADRDGTISDAELQTWLAASKKNLETFAYFTTLRQGREPIALGRAEGHRVERSGGGIALHFTVPLARSADVKQTPLQVDIYDRTFFTEFVLGEGRGITVDAKGAGTCTATVALAPGGEQQKAITAFMKMFGRVDAKLAPAKAITVACME